MDTKEMVVWIVGLTLGAAVLLSPAGCTMHRQYRIEQAIKAGADPLDARCAIEADQSSTTGCILRALQRVKTVDGGQKK